MKTAALLYVRNDNYKEDERVIVCLTSMLDTFDEVFLLDWNSPKDKNPLLWEIEDRLPKTGRLKHIVIPPDAAKVLTNNDPNAQACTQVISTNTESAGNKISNWISCNFVKTPEGENPCQHLSTQTLAQ